jgi:aspartate ammonia-lyase
LRIENDALGQMGIPDEALYGVHSARARENFSLGFRSSNLKLVHAIVKVKQAMARARVKLNDPDADDLCA